MKMLPAGTVIHQQNFYYTGRYHHAEYSSNALIAENNRHFNGKEILNSYTNLYVTFTNGSRNGKIRKSASGTSLMRKLHYPFKQPYKEYQQRLTEMEAFLMNFENGLSSIQQFEIRKMDDTELNNAIYDYVNLSYETPENDATQKSVNPMAVSESGSMKIGQQHVSILSLTNEGEHLQELAVPHTGKSKAYGGNIEIPDSIRSKCSMLYPVGLGLPFNHIVNIVIEITDPDATVTAIGAEKDALNYITNFYPPAAEKQREQAAFCDEITQFDYQTAYTAFNVVLNDTDRTSLMRKTALVQQGFSFMNQSSCYVENAELCNLFFCNIPGNARANYRGFVNTTKQAICYLQKEGMYLSDEKGHIYHDRFGTPAKINLWDYPALNNKNRIVIGPSGSGKSTISKLIARFWDIRKGQITIGGMDVRTIEPEHLMRCMSFVFQDVTLFNDTVFNNIRVGNMNATEEQVMAAAKAAYCNEFIQRLPDGYQTILGENGSTLSGGERQRISIARALLKDAPIILLDEATASLDPENEVLIQRAIAKLVEGKTVIMIAHRLRTVVDADQIIVLKDGKLVEQGTHGELMKKKGLYEKLYHIQQESLGWTV